MNWPLLFKLLGMLSLLVGGTMALSLPWAFPALGVAAQFETKGFQGILAAMAISLTVGGTFSWLGRKSEGTILHKEALAIVGLGWLLAGILGALPFLFSGTMRTTGVPMTIIDALFESISGFTTTGASVLSELEDPTMIPKCVMFWRCFTHWLGGMGIIVLFVALLGHLGGGGKALMQREVPGPLNDTVKPRVREAAMIMWKIYVGLSLVLTMLFLLLGMSIFDALCHAFGTMATGGFSTYNKSIGHFNSISIEVTITLFMLIAGTNFSLFYLMMSGQPLLRKDRWYRRITILVKDPEWKVYISILLLATVILTGNLLFKGVYDSVGNALRHASFISVSIMTTTGFGSEDFSQWGEFAKGLLLLMMFVGGCAGSTGGGIKVVRFILFFKVMVMEVERAFRPKVVRSLRLGGENLPDSLRHDVVVYFSLILFIFISSWMTLNVIEPDTQWAMSQTHTEAEKLLDCASAVAATLNNIGPGLGVLGPSSNFSEFSQQGKLLLTLLMLLGRLELFAVLVLFFPSFWRYQ